MGRGTSCLRVAVLLGLVTAMSGLIAPAASAAPPALWQRCDGGEDDVSCGLLRGVATAPATSASPGNVYVSDQGQKAIREFTAWGEFVKMWGWDVVASGPGENGTGFEICVPANGDVCKAGVQGAGAGQFGEIFGPQGLAVDSTGAVYAVDTFNSRVQKFSASGEFLRMWGKGVNTGTSGNPNLCTNAGPPTDVCGPGSEGTGNGEFSGWPLGSFIAIFTAGTATDADDRVYVGDQGRIQRFSKDGAWVSNITAGIAPSEQIKSLAVDSSGRIYAAIEGTNEVRRWSAAGVLQLTIEVPEPRAIATDAANALYVVSGSSGSLIRKFNASGVELESWGQEEPPSPKLAAPTGIATGSACANANKEIDVYVANNSPAFLRAYGLAPGNLALCPKPAKAPSIIAQFAQSVGTTEATVRAQINPRFWDDTTYWVQYATAACIEGGGWEAACVQEEPSPPGALLGAGQTDFPAATAGVPLSGLSPNTEYRYRFAAQSSGGGPVFGVGGTPGVDGSEASLRTRALAPSEPGPDSCPNAAFRSGFAAQLPDCRAYEMVSPVDKEGGDILAFGTSLGRPAAFYQSATSGDGLTYSTFRAFGEVDSAPYTSQYIARRDPSAGWASEGISPPLEIPTVTVFGESEYKAFSEDLCEGWVIPRPSTEPPLAPGGVEGIPNLYRRENCGAEAGGYEARGAGNSTLFELQGVSADGGHAVFRTETHLAQDAATAAGTQLTCQTTTKATTIAFRWLRDGAPIAGASSVNYTTTAADEGAVVQCQVFAKNSNAGATQVANPAWVIAPYPATEPPEAPEAIAAPSASAPLAVGGAGGQTLSCDPAPSAWEGSPSFSYRWYRNGTEIAGATASTYLVQAADLASPAAFQCEVIATNAGGTVAIASENLTTSPAPSGPAAPVARAISAINALFAGSVYDSTGEGELATVCVLPGTRTQSQACSAGTATVGGAGTSHSVDNAVSADGSRIFWTNAPNNLGKLYVRIDATETVEVSKEAEEASGTSSSRFWTAAADGSKAVFTSGGDLYEFEVDSETTNLIAGEVLGVMGASEDASRIYFVSREVLVEAPNANGDAAQAGEPNLYLYEAGTGDYGFAATLAEADATSSNPSSIHREPIDRVARVSFDGGVAAFVSVGSPTGYDNTDLQSGEADSEVYRYEAASGELECVSCMPSGARPDGRNIGSESFPFWVAAQIPGWQNQLYASRALSDDGSRLFFESFDPLVGRDTNKKQDVYEWEAVGKGTCTTSHRDFSAPNGGCLSLLTSGESPQDSDFIDASPSGNDVFFRTGTSLVGTDPGQFDIYDARVNGGFPEPQVRPPCEGDACQSPAAPPAILTPSSSVFRGPGNVRPRKRCPRGKRRVVRKGKARCVRRKGAKRAAKRRAQRQSGRAGR